MLELSKLAMAGVLPPSLSLSLLFRDDYRGPVCNTPTQYLLLINHSRLVYSSLPLSLVIPKILLLVEQIRPTTAEVYNLGAAIPVLFEARALEAVEGVGDALAAADDALVLVVAEGAFVADAGERGGAHVRVADGALAVALVAQAADRDAGLLAAHDKVAGFVSEVILEKREVR
jgi:hypothetical protein